ncbi:MAG: UDP-N-acetylmuramoyl-tripeptide--D-alanyl-D-alanine ligase [Patescibacteria group bacterium]|jgi:UDP-N-acetylmuramoyl-tripeptide--D-alanyl-D-alanine ligase
MANNFLNIFILVVWFIILLKSIIFWVAIWQIKEYRTDRLLDYFSTLDGKKSFFNKAYILEILTFIILYFCLPSDQLLFKFLFLIFIFAELFLLFKVFVNKSLVLPKWTLKARLIILFSFLTCYYFSLISNFSLIFLVFILIVLPLVVSSCVGIIYPFAYFVKNILIKRAKSRIANQSNLKIVGITGSYGKTSVKEISYQFLSKHLPTLKTFKNQNSEIGLAQTILNHSLQNFKVFVAEMAAYKIGEIKKSCQIAPPDVAVITGLDLQHSALFGGLNNIIKAKSEIIHYAKPNACLVLNYDNEFIRDIALPQNHPVIRYGINHPVVDLRAVKISFVNGVQNFTVEYKNQSINCQTSLIGSHNILNILAGMSVGLALGLDFQDLAQQVAEIKQLDQTLKLVKKQNLFLLDDSYNANPSGVLSALESLTNFSSPRVVILDDILELGKDSVKIHKQVASALAKVDLEKIILVGKNYCNIIKSQLIALGIKHQVILLEKEGESAIVNYLSSIINSNAVVLFEGRRSQKYLKFI